MPSIKTITFAFLQFSLFILVPYLIDFYNCDGRDNPFCSLEVLFNELLFAFVIHFIVSFIRPGGHKLASYLLSLVIFALFVIGILIYFRMGL